jgi:5'-phosphate synthase pdxT subunit
LKIGVLALQGDFAAHSKVLREIGAEAVEVRSPSQMDLVDALIIPGGESTTMLKLIQEEGFAAPIKRFAESGKPIMGTCAGAILLARHVTGPEQPSLSLIDIGVERNAYGRQVDSFIAMADSLLGDEPMEAVFIRAPRIIRTGPHVRTLATVAGEPVLVQSGNIIAATFHPELSGDRRVHRLLGWEEWR